MRIHIEPLACVLKKEHVMFNFALTILFPFSLYLFNYSIYYTYALSNRYVTFSFVVSLMQKSIYNNCSRNKYTKRKRE